ncbi:hypothetical protein JCM21738_1379 [Mesobacillus boroniphilus JCM 21738]|uniref:Uncharacterized protein n=1 Tax=Mesobacillus boroniphilus JCM 21738 TaxID=1294265 RepID=W4RKH8_9BACI|nr:hypothetical protein JCM21738_1379 [Mesobacillus boroniphilus JCM 21738]
MPSKQVRTPAPHLPAFIYSAASTIRLADAISKEKVRSAVVSVSTSGVFVTMMPRFVAASRSILSKPTARFATTLRLSPADNTSSSTLSESIVIKALAFWASFKITSLGAGISSWPHIFTSKSSVRSMIVSSGNFLVI